MCLTSNTIFKAAGKTQTKTNEMAFASTDKTFKIINPRLVEKTNKMENISGRHFVKLTHDTP